MPKSYFELQKDIIWIRNSWRVTKKTNDNKVVLDPEVILSLLLGKIIEFYNKNKIRKHEYKKVNTILKDLLKSGYFKAVKSLNLKFYNTHLNINVSTLLSLADCFTQQLLSFLRLKQYSEEKRNYQGVI